VLGRGKPKRNPSSCPSSSPYKIKSLCLCEYLAVSCNLQGFSSAWQGYLTHSWPPPHIFRDLPIRYAFALLSSCVTGVLYVNCQGYFFSLNCHVHMTLRESVKHNGVPQNNNAIPSKSHTHGVDEHGYCITYLFIFFDRFTTGGAKSCPRRRRARAI
jgi:hypothetical protein